MRSMLATLALLVGVAAPVVAASAEAESLLFSRPAFPPGPSPTATPGLGGGEFGAPTGYAARAATGELRVGDFSGDGRPDALVPQGSLAEVFVQGA